jgi:8-oxo-dGTP pyrophosphatase MutT (NUDIX family)
MHRQPLLTLLERYAQKYPDEVSVVEQVRQLVDNAPDCFQRTCRPGHITGSAWVLSADCSHCLLLHHRKLNRWLQPGGHADGQHQIEQVALREAREESGLARLELVQEGPLLVPLDIDVHTISARRDSQGNLVEDAHQHHDFRFLLIAPKGQPLVKNEESNDIGWFSPERLLEVTREESLLRMLRKAGPQSSLVPPRP